MDTAIAFVSLVVSLIALGLSFYFWRRQFRPIVSAMVKTHMSGNNSIMYNLVIANSGSIPAKNIKLREHNGSVSRALGSDATPQNKARWLACFDEANTIPVLQNDARVSCSFGTTQENDQGFWRYGSRIDVVVRYEGWFGSRYEEKQTLWVTDSNSFTGYSWQQPN